MTSALKGFVYNDKTWQNGPRIINVQLLKIRVQPTIPSHRVVRPLLLRRRVFRHASHFPSNNPTDKHRPQPMRINSKTVMCPTTTSGSSHAALSSTITTTDSAGLGALEPMTDDGTNAAARDGAAEARGVPGA